jgi:predicted GNAT superfamily acetyltransferase
MEMNSMSNSEFTVRECRTIEDFEVCISLQREAFNLPDIEISPRRHFIVSAQAGGWTLGAFSGTRMVGFVHHLAAVSEESVIFGYSHMMAVAKSFQNRGVGALLKWSQRERALREGRRFIKWTWDPMQSRNAHFNLNRLGVIVSKYAENFYGTDYPGQSLTGDRSEGIDSDRLFAEWHLDSERVKNFAAGQPEHLSSAAAEIEIPGDWQLLVSTDRRQAHDEQLRVRDEFRKAFDAGLICTAFTREGDRPRYLLTNRQASYNV